MNLTPQQAMRAAVAVPGVPRDEDGPVFREPWEARAFAMALALHEAGLFTWKEWAETLGAQIKRAQAAGDPDTGETYYQHWLATLETLVAAKGVATADILHRYRDAWDHAADRTPHGAPVELTKEDFGYPSSPGLTGADPVRRGFSVQLQASLEYWVRPVCKAQATHDRSGAAPRIPASPWRASAQAGHLPQP